MYSPRFYNLFLSLGYKGALYQPLQLCKAFLPGPLYVPRI